MKLTTDRYETSRGLFATAELLVLCIEAYNQRQKCYPCKGDDGVAHSFNCIPAFVRYASLADALVE